MEVLVIMLLAALFVLIISIPVCIIKSSQARKNQKKRMEELGCVVEVSLKHFTGLPIPENSPCTFQVYKDCYKTFCNGAEFKLDRTKVTDICLKTDVEIQKQSVSSIGGAIGGAMLFGPVGAMIGGRAKNKEIRTATTYLIVSYMKDDEMKYIAFEIPYLYGGIDKIIKDFKENKVGTTSIEL